MATRKRLSNSTKTSRTTFFERLIGWREEAGLSQGDVAAALGMTKARYESLELDGYPPPHPVIYNVRKAADVLGVEHGTFTEAIMADRLPWEARKSDRDKPIRDAAKTDAKRAGGKER